MTATITPTTTSTVPDAGTATPRSLWRTGAGAGVIAAFATVAVAGIAHAAGVSLETAPGQAVPVLGFGQLTLFFTAVGVLIARCLRSRARRPRSTFTRTTVALTALSVVPDVLLSASVSTKMTLVVTHLVAAAIVVPALSARMPEAAVR